jgi:hypothetical protein
MSGPPGRSLLVYSGLLFFYAIAFLIFVSVHIFFFYFPIQENVFKALSSIKDLI